jgi:hypothetical protein
MPTVFEALFLALVPNKEQDILNQTSKLKLFNLANEIP